MHCASSSLRMLLHDALVGGPGQAWKYQHSRGAWHLAAGGAGAYLALANLVHRANQQWYNIYKQGEASTISAHRASYHSLEEK